MKDQIRSFDKRVSNEGPGGAVIPKDNGAIIGTRTPEAVTCARKKGAGADTKVLATSTDGSVLFG